MTESEITALIVLKVREYEDSAQRNYYSSHGSEAAIKADALLALLKEICGNNRGDDRDERIKEERIRQLDESIKKTTLKVDGLKTRLSNASFLTRARPDVVEATKSELKTLENTLKSYQTELEKLTLDQ